MPRLLIFTLGSHGDVHPFIGLGLALQRRGHDVLLFTNGHFRAMVERAGLKFVELGSDATFREGIQNKDLWHRKRAFKAVLEWGVVPLIAKTFELIEQHHLPGQTVLIGSSLAIGARVARDRLDIPMATVHLAPVVFRSLLDPPVLPGLFMPKWLPHRFKEILMAGGDKYVIDPIIAPEINRVRANLGLKPVSAVLKDWWHSPDLTIGMFPDWYAPLASDWPRQVLLTSFPLWDESGHHELPADLQAFFADGPPPVAFTPGTAMVHAERFFDTAVRSCLRMNRRGLLVTRHAEHVPSNLPSSIRHVLYAPFSELLPRCAALVHHGGIGTTAQALAAGIPQLVMPMAHDQPDNARRLERLGVGASLRPANFSARNVTRQLAQLLNDPAVLSQAKGLSLRLRSHDGINETVDLIEPLIPHSVH